MVNNFDAKKVKEQLIIWIKEWFDLNGSDCNAVIGISGGKDSTVVAALCVEALGKNRVIGVMMPQGEQIDIDDSYKVVNYLGIKHFVVNIENAVKSVEVNYKWNSFKELSEQALINLPPRIRMATLYAVSQSNNGRVSNNCNLSEDWVGYSTRYGDSVGDFSPLSKLTVTEVKAIGKELGLPTELVDKTPSDGLCGKTDEEKLGFSYDLLDRYIRTGEIDDVTIKQKIDILHKKNLFKLQLMDSFDPNL